MSVYRAIFIFSISAIVVCSTMFVFALENRSNSINSSKPEGDALVAAQDTCEGQSPGDFNSDGQIDPADMAGILMYVCEDGPGPAVPANGDPNGDCVIDSADIDYLSSYIFGGGPLPVECTCVEPVKGECYADTCEGQVPGDVNSDGEINFGDPAYLLQYLCGDYPPPDPLANGDPNGDCIIDTNDINYLNAFITYSGPPPVECTCVEPSKGDCPDTCYNQKPGDFNGDNNIDMNDVTGLMSYLCEEGPPPVRLANADPNGDCYINFLDADFLLVYIYQGGPPPVECTCVEPIKGECECDCVVGDANGDGQVNVGDPKYIINYVFEGGPAPVPYENCSGDANCDCQVNVGDAVYLIAHIFKFGPAPCDCKNWMLTCDPPLRK